MNRSILRSLLLPAFFLELSMITLLRAEFGNHKSAFLFFSCSFLIGVAGIWLAFLVPNVALQPVTKIPTTKRNLFYTYTLIGLALSSFLLNKIITSTPIDVKYSDIIPLVQKMATRFLNGEYVYAVINDWGYELFPTYLPLQWLPFSVAELLHFDYRWAAYFVCTGAIITFGVFALRRNIHLERFSLLLLLPAVFFVLFYKLEPVVFGVTVETLVVGYYLLVALSIFSTSNIVRALGLTLCLLSRYSLVLWVPLYILILFFVESKRNAILIAAFCVAGALLLYILPFMTVNMHIFPNALKAYHGAAVGEWSGQAWQQPGEKPAQLFRGIGFAGLLYDAISGDIVTKVNTAQRLHLIFSLGVSVLLGIFYYFYRAKLNYRVFLLGSFKVYLAVFYSFIQVPYSYLFLSMIIISLPILAIAMIEPTAPSEIQEEEVIGAAAMQP